VPGVEPGASGHARRTVTDADTASALGSGDVPVFGTPALLALCEAATLDAIAGDLAPSDTTVGVDVALEHTAAAQAGGLVTARATLEAVDGRILTFEVKAESDGRTIGVGTIRRAIVDRRSFLDRVQRTP